MNIASLVHILAAVDFAVRMCVMSLAALPGEANLAAAELRMTRIRCG